MSAAEWVFREPTLEEAMRAIWDAAADAPPRQWSSFDSAVAECEPPELVHPRFDDPDQYAAYHYRNEVGAA